MFYKRVNVHQKFKRKVVFVMNIRANDRNVVLIVSFDLTASFLTIFVKEVKRYLYISLIFSTRNQEMVNNPEFLLNCLELHNITFY